MRIIAPATTTYATVRDKLTLKGASDLFLDHIAPAVWDTALAHGIHPVGMVAQAAKETNYGRFGGRIDARWFNTCGLKVRDLKLVAGVTGNPSTEQPMCHQMFGSWKAGATAHAIHLWAYAGLKHPNPELDPRWVWVYPKAHNLTDWEQLGGRWAPAVDYGQQITTLAGELT